VKGHVLLSHLRYERIRGRRVLNNLRSRETIKKENNEGDNEQPKVGEMRKKDNLLAL
jgi:hypothetical protein